MHKRTPTKSGGRQPAVVVAMHWQRKANSLRMTSVRIRSGGREPAVGVVTQLRRRSCMDDRRAAPVRQLRCCCYKRVSETTAGLRQPLLVARTHTAVDARLRPATALCSPRGTNAPLLCWCANVCRRKNDFCDAQTHVQKERRASARRGYEKHVCADTGAVVRRTADGVCADCRCIRVNSCHGGLTPPASCVAVRTSAGEKTIFAMHKRTPRKSGGRQPAVVCGTALARAIPLSRGRLSPMGW
jgi:hypothetical protein